MISHVLIGVMFQGMRSGLLGKQLQVIIFGNCDVSYIIYFLVFHLTF